MKTAYSADVDDIDQPILDADSQRKPEETLRIRLQPTILNRIKGQHRMWPGVSWTIDCQTAQEAISLRKALRAFFDAAGRVGPDVATLALDGLTITEQPAP